MIMIHKKNILYHNKTCIQVCLSVDSLVNAPVDVQIGNPAACLPKVDKRGKYTMRARVAMPCTCAW